MDKHLQPHKTDSEKVFDSDPATLQNPNFADLSYLL